MRRIIGVLAFSLFAVSITPLAFAQSDSTNPPSNPTVTKPTVEEEELPRSPFASDSPYIPVQDWVGKKFVFRSLGGPPRMVNHYNFIHWKDKPDSPGPTDKELGGKVATVIAVSMKDADSGTVDLQVEGEPTVYAATVFDGYVQDIIPLLDIEYARKEFVGKTFWLMSDKMREDFFARLQGTKVTAPRFSKIEVIDAVAGGVIIKMSSGESKLIPMSLNRINLPRSVISLRGPATRYGVSLFPFDPRLKYNWEPKIWDAIEARQVIVGMTRIQASFAWGGPTEINKVSADDEQWLYAQEVSDLEWIHNRKDCGVKIVYFADGKVKRVQNETTFSENANRGTKVLLSH